MIARRVRYTVKESFVEENKANIRKVMAEVKGLGESGLLYTSFVEPDGKTFVHVVILRDESLTEVIGNTDAFKAFQAGLKPNLEVPPEAVTWEVAGATYDL